MPVARILFPMPLPEPFDYLIPEGMDVEPGSYVRAPLGKYERTGVVWAVEQADPDRELKTIEHHFDVPPMTPSMRRFVEFCARYNVAGPGQVLAMALRARGGLSPSPTQTIYEVTGHRTNRMTPAREKILAAATELGPNSAAELARAAGVGDPAGVQGPVRSGSGCRPAAGCRLHQRPLHDDRQRGAGRGGGAAFARRARRAHGAAQPPESSPGPTRATGATHGGAPRKYRHHTPGGIHHARTPGSASQRFCLGRAKTLCAFGY